ncbi:MAG: hypothetical protein KJO43_14935 [Phycisphaerae bacterium]|nr:hypothetical protein [Phycisphaerae bacterium]
MTRLNIPLSGAAALLLVTLVTTPSPASEASDETGAPGFHMIHATRGNAAIGVFTPDGPQLGTMQKGAKRVAFITHDPSTGTYFGQQVSTLGVIEDGKLTPVETPESVDMSHPGGLAFDAERASVLLASRSGAGTVLFTFTPATNTWNEIGNLGRDDLQGLACDGAQGTIYVLERPRTKRACTNLRVFNHTGAQVAAVDLSTPIPFLSDLRPKLQLAHAQGQLFALVTHERTHPRVTDAIYAIDPATGEVSRTAFNANRDVTSKTWPGWKGGPTPSSPMSAGTAGRGFYSNYVTPAKLVRRQRSEMHVIAVESGETNYFEYLKKIKSLKAGSKNGSGVEIAIELDIDAEINHPVVEVFVDETDKPVTLALASATNVVWSIEPAPGAKIAKIYKFGAPHFDNSQVVGVDPSLVIDGGTVDAACAWELGQSSSATGFDEMIATIREKTGLREHTFRGLGTASSFRVPERSSDAGGTETALVE